MGTHGTRLWVAAVLHCGLVAPLFGQPGSVAGHVVSALGDSVPFALISLLPRYGDRFADQRGRFDFGAVPGGTYRLRVRQIGFTPLDTSVVVSSERLVVVARLEPLAIRLTALTVSARQHCETPGLELSGAGPELRAVLTQLRENAERYAVLVDSYPFRYRLERTFATYTNQRDMTWSFTDTVEYSSSGRPRYRPGDVIRWGRGPAGSSARVVELPTLADFADGAFQATHCFAYAGTMERDGQRRVRISFTVVDSLRRPDVEGDVELDVAGYQVRRANIRLTRASQASGEIVAATSTVDFGELLPSLVIPQRVESVLRYTLAISMPPIFRSWGGDYTARWWRPTRGVARSTERQRLIHVRFQRPLPGAADSVPGVFRP